MRVAAVSRRGLAGEAHRDLVRGYCCDATMVRVYSGVPEALRRLREAGWGVFIMTNQSGIGRGLITHEQYRAVHSEFLRQAGTVDGTYYCPDGPEVPSTRRKPEPGMVLEAARSG